MPGAAAKRMTAAERWHRDLAAHREQSRREEQERRDQVIAEFSGNPQAMADAILRYRHAANQLADAIDWMQRGGSFVTLGPGPHWPGHNKQHEAEEGEP